MRRTGHRLRSRRRFSLQTHDLRPWFQQHVWQWRGGTPQQTTYTLHLPERNNTNYNLRPGYQENQPTLIARYLLHCALSCAVYCNRPCLFVCVCVCLFVCGSALQQPARSVCVASERFFIVRTLYKDLHWLWCCSLFCHLFCLLYVHVAICQLDF